MDLYGFVTTKSSPSTTLSRANLKKKENADKQFVNSLGAIGGLQNIHHPTSEQGFAAMELLLLPVSFANLAYQGFPAAFRPSVWTQLINSSRSQKTHPNPPIFDTETQIIPDDIKTQIANDVDRTFPNHEKFKPGSEGLHKLTKVLTQIALSLPQIGYCQGLNFIVGMISIFFDENESFNVAIAMINSVPRDYFSPTMLDIHADVLVFEHLLRDFTPALHTHFRKLEFQAAVIVNSWLVSLFVGGSFTTTFTLRIWDCIFFSFDSPNVLIRIMLQLFNQFERDLMKLKMYNEIFRFVERLGDHVTAENTNEIIKKAMNMGKPWSFFSKRVDVDEKIAKLRKRYREKLEEAKISE